MKVIFLDVDGVLNSENDLRVFREKNNITGTILYAEVEDRPLKLLKELVEKSGAKIVVSSSWRIGCERSGRESIFGASLYEKLVRRLRDYGMEVYDITPSLSGNAQRGDEIREWLQTCESDIDSFVILDDDADMCEFVGTNLVQTTYKHGLTEDAITKALQVLEV